MFSSLRTFCLAAACLLCLLHLRDFGARASRALTQLSSSSSEATDRPSLESLGSLSRQSSAEQPESSPRTDHEPVPFLPRELIAHIVGKVKDFGFLPDPPSLQLYRVPASSRGRVEPITNTLRRTLIDLSKLTDDAYMLQIRFWEYCRGAVYGPPKPLRAQSEMQTFLHAVERARAQRAKAEPFLVQLEKILGHFPKVAATSIDLHDDPTSYIANAQHIEGRWLPARLESINRFPGGLEGVLKARCQGLPTLHMTPSEHIPNFDDFWTWKHGMALIRSHQVPPPPPWPADKSWCHWPDGSFPSLAVRPRDGPVPVMVKPAHQKRLRECGSLKINGPPTEQSNRNLECAKEVMMRGEV